MNTVKIKRKEQYAIVELANGKVNAINAELSKDLAQAFTELEADKSVKAAILTGQQGCFSAGMDVVAMATADLEGTKELWRAYMMALRAMVRFSKPLIGAISGFAPAGGTIFALCTDYRIMAKGEKHVMGMHEFKMSMVVPRMMSEIYAYQLGEPVAWEAIQNARLFNSDQAASIGLVHESVAEEDVLIRAEQHLQKMMKVYLPTYQTCKQMFRKGLLDIVNQDIETLVDEIAKGWEDPFTQKIFQTFMEKLKRKS
ncbi:MAG: enoyl-CoA hydratase/isomerase family protein [Bacteroidota bacterium]